MSLRVESMGRRIPLVVVLGQVMMSAVILGHNRGMNQAFDYQDI